MELVRKFEELDTVQNKNHNRARMLTNEDMQIGVHGLLAASRTQFNSSGTLSEVYWVSATSLHGILKLAKCFPYKVLSISQTFLVLVLSVKT